MDFRQDLRQYLRQYLRQDLSKAPSTHRVPASEVIFTGEPLDNDSRRTHGIRVPVAPQRTLNAAPGCQPPPEPHYDVHDLLEL